MEAEEDAERLLRRTEKRAFAAFKISFFLVIEACNNPCFLHLRLKLIFMFYDSALKFAYSGLNFFYQSHLIFSMLLENCESMYSKLVLSVN